eukprot:SAG11_NODE_697_length_7684_cov_8.250231_11_plen_151_part_00
MDDRNLWQVRVGCRFATAGAVPSGEAVWEYDDRPLMVVELSPAEAAARAAAEAAAQVKAVAAAAAQAERVRPHPRHASLRYARLPFSPRSLSPSFLWRCLPTTASSIPLVYSRCDVVALRGLSIFMCVLGTSARSAGLRGCGIDECALLG